MTNHPTDQITAFFAELSDAQQFVSLYEHIPGVLFFVKDRNSRLVTCNREMLGLFRREHVSEIYGKTGLDFFPTGIASAFLDDDRRVMESKEPMVDALELNVSADGSIAWFCTTKIPLLGKNGAAIGLQGVTRRLRSADRSLHPGARIMPVIDYIQDHLHENVEITTLAKLCHLSPSQFHRSFKGLFRQSPLQFISKLRMQHVCQLLLTSDASIGEIAENVGFQDQNYLTRQFKAITGMTPTAYKKRYR